jgi:hypothetical protein
LLWVWRYDEPSNDSCARDGLAPWPGQHALERALVRLDPNDSDDPNARWLAPFASQFEDTVGVAVSCAVSSAASFRRVNLGQMDIDVTIDDPKAYTRPWTVRVTHRLMVDTELIEHICHENQKFGPALN